MTCDRLKFEKARLTREAGNLSPALSGKQEVRRNAKRTWLRWTAKLQPLARPKLTRSALASLMASFPELTRRAVISSDAGDGEASDN